MGLGRGLDRWLELRRGEGWQAEVRETRTKGFPFAFETRVEGISLVDPETGLGWTAPRFDIRAEAHAPTYVEAIWPDTQEILTPHETISVEAIEIAAGLGLVPGPALALDTSDVSLISVTLRSSAGWNARLDSGELATRRLADPLIHDITFSARGLKPARQILELLDPLAKLPPSITTMELDMEAAFDAPWDRHAIEDRRPQPTALDIRLLKAKWGRIEFEAAGAVTVDGAMGRPRARSRCARSTGAMRWRWSRRAAGFRPSFCPRSSGGSRCSRGSRATPGPSTRRSH